MHLRTRRPSLSRNISSAAQPAALQKGLELLKADFGRRQVEQCLTYLDLLKRWNRAVNLTAVTKRSDMLAKHVLDSAAALSYVVGPRVLDIGTGAGLPGLVIAILRDELQVVVLDSRLRRIQFLIHAVSELGLGNVRTVHERVEKYRPSRKFDTLTARAVGSIPVVLARSRHLMGPESRLVVWKGGYPGAEIASLPEGFGVAAAEPVTVPGLGADRHIIVIESSEDISGTRPERVDLKHG